MKKQLKAVAAQVIDQVFAAAGDDSIKEYEQALEFSPEDQLAYRMDRVSYTRLFKWRIFKKACTYLYKIGKLPEGYLEKDFLEVFKGDECHANLERAVAELAVVFAEMRERGPTSEQMILEAGTGLKFKTGFEPILHLRILTGPAEFVKYPEQFMIDCISNIKNQA